MEIGDLQVGDYAFMVQIDPGCWRIVAHNESLGALRHNDLVVAAVQDQNQTWRFVQIMDPAPFRGADADGKD